ncbi:SpoIIE family protein phosphatase [Nonomuraea sp. MCN248]|uniref:SpoIIE family protein phosphatase n=1 Tax=Nonomuraea corallina TaxID=2989783 RepID=A0ABT4SC74_9ACTN|nr:SpoIIE family protein phosphatase [Nonomuraea corallina]MDA0634801.1 SpoIIE family protein phosphatase [Nonomuraea corallina]
MEPSQNYFDRLADLDARLGRARGDDAMALERAAGILAGRTSCRIAEAHAYLRRIAADQGREVFELAAEVLAALEGDAEDGPERLRAAVASALRPPLRAPSSAGGDWARVAQQVLDALGGSHTVLMPVRGAGGRIEDYVFTAAGPELVDISGRRGTEIVGLRVSEVYPTLMGGPVWDAWERCVADGMPRQVGPIPYVSVLPRAPAEMSISVQVRSVGPGVINTWVRHDVETRLEVRSAQTERLGNLGWGEWDLVTGEISWSPGLYRVYERDPAGGPLSQQALDALTLPEDVPVRAQAAVDFALGRTADLTYRVRIGARVKHLRMIADAVRDSGGRPVRVFGVFQDVTARETTRIQLARVEEELLEHRRSLEVEHRLAAELQHIVLPIPAEPIDLPRLRVAVRYLPAVQAQRVGGDWYHAAIAGDGSVVLAIGDVAGHGVRAAACMAQLRHALAALAVTTTSDPAELLSHLNHLLYVGGEGTRTATAVVGRYLPDTGELRWAQAGHPPPLHTRGGRTIELDRPHGPLLGAVSTAAYGTAAMTIEPGDLLLLYTDGLVERRDRTLREGLIPVISILDRTSAQRSPQPVADVITQLPDANPHDDTCVLAARRLPVGESGHG